MRRIIIIVCAAALGTCAYARVGSVISSFHIGNPGSISVYGSLYRDPSHVYAVWDYGGQNYLRRYTATGSFVNQVYIGYRDEGIGDADHCHLGRPYFAFVDLFDLTVINANDGSIAASFAIKGPGTWRPYNVMWDGKYYYVNQFMDYGVFNRYTSAGSLAGKWAAAGWPSGMRSSGVAFAHRFDNVAGRYLLAAAAGRSCAINMVNGSLIATWPLPLDSCYGAVYGDAAPSSYGAAMWVHSYIYPPGRNWAYQIDVGARAAASVLPASLGKVKAIYR